MNRHRDIVETNCGSQEVQGDANASWTLTLLNENGLQRREVTSEETWTIRVSQLKMHDKHKALLNKHGCREE